ncbi:Chemotaxis protein methyltransferase CheR [Fimbriiglobus ruber]|uniref:Chemotaxis protein methyltransferase CheR n=1 Tax=Fimbriiglobus ruber TaxID=1908690 RepID=A0A225DRX8_9BACT|nr:Chemotaxis protein methyltransferase CheR [Fimbriiglobus ruber]
MDDNRDVADSAALLLELIGYETRACYDGPAALEQAATFQPDVCLIDLNMPGMNGDELAVRLREQAGRQSPVLIVVTAMSDENSRHRIAAANFDQHLTKPVDPPQLLAVLTRFLQP